MQFNGKTPSAFMHVDTVGIIADNAVGNFGWSSRNIVDKLCPAFVERGSVVTCEPVEGYPLEVVSVIPETQQDTIALQLFRGGKNLFDFKAGTYSVTCTDANNAQMTKAGYEIHLPAGVYTLHAETIVEQQASYIYGFLNDKDGNFKVACDLVRHNSIAPQTVTVADGDVLYIYHGVYETPSKADTEFALFNIQLEAGCTATPYEEYCGEFFTADFSKFPNRVNDGGAYNWITGVFTDNAGDEWQHNLETGEFVMVDTNTDIVQVVRSIPALAGTNSLYEESGSVVVKGRLSIERVIKCAADSQKTYELIEDITLDADVATFERDTDKAGNPFDFRAVTIFVDAPVYADAATSDAIIFNMQNADKTHICYFEQKGAFSKEGARKTTFKAKNDCGLTELYATTIVGSSGANMYSEQGYPSLLWTNVCKIRLSAYPTTKIIPAGTRIQIYGIRG